MATSYVLRDRCRFFDKAVSVTPCFGPSFDVPNRI